MKIKIVKKKIKVEEKSELKSSIASSTHPTHQVMNLFYHPVILFFGSVAFVILAINIFANFIFKSQVVYVSLQSQNEMTGVLNQGTLSPGFILSNMTNGKVSNLNFRGSPLVILFWTTWNQLSIDQLNLIDRYMSKSPETSVKFLAINSQEDKNIVASFIKRGGYKIPVALDENGGVTEAYGARNLPATYFIDGTGVVKSSSVGHLDEESLVRKLEAIID